MEKRGKFSPQFKAEAVQMVIETGKPIAEVARDLGLVEQTLGNWVKAWRQENPEPGKPNLTPLERARVKELEDENRRLRMENEFLKKAAASSRGRPSSRALRGDRSGEGRLRHCLDVPAARRAEVELLCLAQPGRDHHRGPPAEARRSLRREHAVVDAAGRWWEDRRRRSAGHRRPRTSRTVHSCPGPCC
jgi:transposase